MHESLTWRWIRFACDRDYFMSWLAPKSSITRAIEVYVLNASQAAGQAHVPNHEMIIVDQKFWIERLSR
jgi:hypothetical protein